MELITLIGAVTVFILAIFLGFELITKVPPTSVSYTHLRAHET